MKRNLLSVFIILASSIQMSSCTKTVSQQQANSVYGLWVGTYYKTGAVDTEYISLTFEPNGTVMEDAYADNKTSENLGLGTWNMNGDTLNCVISNVYGKYSNNEGSFTAIYNQATGQLTQGQWKSILPGVIGGGYFTVGKVK